MFMNKWTVIVPTNRPAKFLEFLQAWYDIFKKHDVLLVVIEDAQERSVDISHALSNCEFLTVHRSWRNMDNVGLKHIPKKTDMCRSYGFWLGYEISDSPYFLTLDDDVKPIEWQKWRTKTPGDIFEEYEKVFEAGEHLSEYFSIGSLTTTPTEIEMRGYPYKDRVKKPVAVQYGGWWGVLDYDAATQLSSPQPYQQFAQLSIPVPKGAAATCCIMNCAWRREYTPIMWQLTMLNGRYNRVGDIWSGLFIKKTLDMVGACMVINGFASVEHNRASDPYNSLVKEAPSVYMNDHLWENLNVPVVSEDNNLLDVYLGVTNQAIWFFEKHDKEYAEYFRKARDEWLSLWQN